MGSKSTPKPPDLTPMSNAQLEISREQLAQARDQMNMSQKQFDKFTQQTDAEMKQSQKQYDTQMGLQGRALDQADAAAAVSKSVAEKQIQAMDQNMGFAQEDRNRYTNVELPMEDKFIAEANGYDTPARREQAASQALADNQTQIEAQKANTASQLASMGVDPSQVMSTSLSNQMGVAGAAAGAMNANNARLQVEGTGRQLQAAAIDMGNGLPAQAQAGYNTASNSGQVAANATNAATSGYSTASGIGAAASGIRQNSLNTASSITGSPTAWAQLGNQSYGGASNGIMNASNIVNQGFQNQMSVQKMKNDQSAATMNAVGSMAGMAAMFMAEGGSVPDFQFDAPTLNIQDLRPSQVSAVKGPTGMTRDSKIQAGLMGASALATGLGASAGGGHESDNDPNLQQHFLHPVYRAEGGIMGFSSGMGSAPPPRAYQGGGTPSFSMGNGMAPAPRPYQPAPAQPYPASSPIYGGMRGGMMGGGMMGGGMSGRMGRPMMFAEGGSAPDAGQAAMGSPQYQIMPNIQSRDRIHAMLAPGEAVIPADVVRIKGQEFFDKLIAKHHRPGA